MLVTRRGERFTCVTQYDHGALAGELAARWGNERFARRPRGSPRRCAAAAHHDDGWRELDDLPGPQRGGRPPRPLPRAAAGADRAALRPRRRLGLRPRPARRGAGRDALDRPLLGALGPAERRRPAAHPLARRGGRRAGAAAARGAARGLGVRGPAQRVRSRGLARLRGAAGARHRLAGALAHRPGGAERRRRAALADRRRWPRSSSRPGRGSCPRSRPPRSASAAT